MKRETTLHQLYVLYTNDELKNEIIVFKPDFSHYTLCEEKLTNIYDGAFRYESEFALKLMNSLVKWFNFDYEEKKCKICLVYEDWMDKYCIKGK